MALETDSGHWTVTAGVQWDWVLFNDVFSVTPSGSTIIFGVIDKEKSAIDLLSLTTAGASATAESGTDVRYLAKEPGYSPSGASTHPEMDSVVHIPTLEKTLESISFNNTFTATPIVITGYEGDAAADGYKGGKTSAGNITTTGCDVATEFKADTQDRIQVFIIYTNGFWEV